VRMRLARGCGTVCRAKCAHALFILLSEIKSVNLLCVIYKTPNKIRLRPCSTIYTKLNVPYICSPLWRLRFFSYAIYLSIYLRVRASP
jgi:hypothetical protein